MLKAKAVFNGKDAVILGLSFSNLAALRAEAGETYLHIEGKELEIPFDIIIISGKDEPAMVRFLRPAIGPNTKMNISLKSRS